MLIGLIGVASFALTLPATRYLVNFLDPVFIGLGRGFVAALFAILILLISRQPWPSWREIQLLALVSLGVVIGFPLLSSMAMQTLPAAHGGVVLGILPLATACAGALINQERPSKIFWLFSVIGTLLVLIFARFDHPSELGGWTWQGDDLILLAAVISASIGYAVGAKLTATMGGWQVICWALVLALPFIAVPTLASLKTQPNLVSLPISAIACFVYLALISQLIGFFFWYKGLALGGVARVSQLQLLQPFMTLVASAWLLQEIVGLRTWLFAFLVMLVVALSKQTTIVRSRHHTTNTSGQSQS
jgi:drug/metabolite transporter (DMT)-like permease